MKRQFRLTRSIDIKRVRRSGSSFAHPLVVLYVHKTEKPETHVAVSAGMGVGNAVKRNRAKRLLRAAMNDLMPKTSPGFDLLLIARAALPAANVHETRAALASLLKRAGLLSQSYEF